MVCRLRKYSDLTKIWEQSSLISEYAKQPLRPVTLDKLMQLGRNKDITQCALYAHTELPVRLARRVASIQKLPYIVGVNPYIESVCNLYRSSFFKMLELDEPTNPEALEKFTKTLDVLAASHQNVIANLAQGFMECRSYMSKDVAKEFLDNMIHARIAIRVIAEHLLSLSLNKENWIGVVNTQTSPQHILQGVCNTVQELCEINYGSCPEFDIVGHVNVTFAYIPVHLEYIFMELIKNAFRATVEHSEKTRRMLHPPVEICISSSQNEVVVRVRDQGGGIPMQDLERVWDYSYTTVPHMVQQDDFLAVQSRITMQKSTGGPIAGLGFGLPMSRIYAKYFGGSLEFRSVVGHGVDMYVRFPNITQISQSTYI